MAEPILKLTRGVPKTDREWMEVFRNLTKLLKVRDGGLVIDGSIQLPAGSVGTIELQPDSVTGDKLRDSAGLSVIGNPAAAGANPSDIVSTVADSFLVRRGSALTWDALEDGDIPGSIARDAEVTSAISAAVAAAIAALNLANGAYTPTLNIVANLDSVTPYPFQYLRVGSTVTVSGRIDADPTAGGSATTQVRISLPVATTFASTSNCSGVGHSSAITQGAAVFADTVNHDAVLSWFSGTTSSHNMFVMFTYRIA